MFARARLVLAGWYLVAVALTVGVLGVTSYLIVRDDLDAEIDRSLRSARAEILPLSSLPGEAVPTPTVDPGDEDDDSDDDHDDDSHEEDEDAPTSDEDRQSLPSDVFYVSFAANGSVAANPRRIDLDGFDLQALAAGATADTAWMNVSAAGERYRLAISRWPASEGLYLAVGRSLAARDHQLRSLAVVFAAGGVVALIVSGLAGMWLAGRALMPIRQTLEAQQRFVSDASHELRTPLATVRANGELLLRNPDATIESRLDQVEAVIVETDQMTRLVDDLLTLARSDERQQELGLEQLDLSALVAEVCRDLHPLADRAGIELNCETAACIVEGDRRRLRQLCVILLDNALQHTPPGGTIAVRCHPDGKQALLVVSDTGPGIPPEALGRVFDRFFRVDPSRTRASGGSGLGLAIAQWIVEAHHGRIVLDSQVGEGTTFTVRI